MCSNINLFVIFAKTNRKLSSPVGPLHRRREEHCPCFTTAFLVVTQKSGKSALSVPLFVILGLYLVFVYGFADFDDFGLHLHGT